MERGAPFLPPMRTPKVKGAPLEKGAPVERGAPIRERCPSGTCAPLERAKALYSGNPKFSM